MSGPSADDLPLASLAAPLRVRSRLLGEEIWLVPDGLCGPPGQVCYSVSELRILLSSGLDGEAWKALHAVKKAVDGTVEGNPPKAPEGAAPR